MMKRENYVKILYACSTLFALLFAIKTALDYVKFDEINNSAPFYDFIIDNALIFLLPALIIFIIAIILKKKGRKIRCKGKKCIAAICVAICLVLTACGGSGNEKWQEEGKELLSERIESGELMIDGTAYTFPSMLLDWLDSGWHISNNYENIDTFELEPYNESDIFELFKGDKYVLMSAYNDSEEAALLKDCMVSYLSVDMTDFEAILPGGLNRDSELEAVKEAYGKPADKEAENMYEILYYRYEKNLSGYDWICTAGITVYQNGVTKCPLSRVEFFLSDENWEEEEKTNLQYSKVPWIWTLNTITI